MDFFIEQALLEKEEFDAHYEFLTQKPHLNWKDREKLQEIRDKGGKLNRLLSRLEKAETPKGHYRHRTPAARRRVDRANVERDETDDGRDSDDDDAEAGARRRPKHRGKILRFKNDDDEEPISARTRWRRGKSPSTDSD